MQVGVPFVAHQEAAVAVQPGEGALDHPAVAPQLLAGLDAPAGDARGDMAAAQQAAVLCGIVALVSVQFARSAAGPTPASTRWPQGRERIDEALQDGALVDVGGGDEQRQWGAAPFGYQMVLAARPAPIGRIRPRRSAPLFAGTREASALARLQSIFPASARSCSRTRWSRSQTPACCQSRSRRHRVIPQQPISRGKYSHGRPVFSTKMMPASATRLGTGGCPTVPGGRVAGRSGSTTAHSSSLTNALAIPRGLQPAGQFC